MKSELQKEFEADHKDFSKDPWAQAVLAEGLAIQDRFKAEPIYARTGKGYLKSAGVEELAECKKDLRPFEKK